MVKITIRDGRVGRELAPDGKGAVLGTVERSNFLEIGDKIALPDGTPAIIIGDEMTLGGGQAPEQVVFVGSTPGQKAG